MTYVIFETYRTKLSTALEVVIETFASQGRVKMEDEIAYVMLYRKARRRRNHVRAIRRTLRDTSNPFEMLDSDFLSLYRIPKEGVRYIVDAVEEDLPPTRITTAMPPLIRVLTVLNFLASGSYQRNVGQDFHHTSSQASVSISLKTTCHAIVRVLMPRWIKFPTSAADINKVKLRFMEISGVPGVIGAVDGTHIAIVPPSADREYHFINRKHFHSKNVMIARDYDLRITAVHAGFGGRTHDASVWKDSVVRHRLQLDYLSGERNKWLIGDSRCPNEPWLLAPFRNPEENSPEGRFNAAHRRARNCVERCIGVLKGWFRCLKRDRTLHYSLERAGFIILSCTVLHNIALHYRVPLPQDIDLEEEELIVLNPEDINVTREGRNVRGAVVRTNFT